MNLPAACVLASLVVAPTSCISPVLVPGEPSRDAPTRTEPAPAPTPPTSGAWAELRRAILDEVNATRRAHGAPRLADDARLAAAAVDYSAELARTRRLTHESDTPDRRTLDERLAAAGMTEWTLIGENLAMTSTAARELPARVVRMWLDSPGHRRNLLNREFTLSGIGIARTGEGHWYVAQVYARPLPRAR
jgi:uncharacterized protein YkwD